MYIKGIITALGIFIAYFLLIVVLSSLILGQQVKREGLTKRFMIYLVFGNLHLSSLVFILAYLGIFNRISITVSLVLSSSLIWLVLNRSRLKQKFLNIKSTLSNLVLRKYGYKLFLLRQLKAVLEKLKIISQEITLGNKLECIFFLAILGWNLYQYNINNFSLITYMAPDEEVHLYWIQSLIGGNIFPSGIYPHIFHNVLGAINEVFNLKALVTLRYFGVTSCILIMTTLYLGLRRILHSKYAALFGFLLYTILNIYAEGATIRFQFVIPQEYAMLMLMPLAIFLIDYIRNKKIQDLVFFGITLSLVVGIHFYTGIIGIILVFSIGIASIGIILREKIAGKLLICGVLSAFMAIAPLGLGLVLGHEMEQSMSWATSVIRGDIYSENKEENKKGLKEDSKSQEKWQEIDQSKDQSEKDKDQGDKSKLDPVKQAKKDITKNVVTSLYVFYFLLGIITLSLIYNLILLVFKRGDEKSLYKLAFAINSLLLIFLTLFRSLGWPTIMEANRIAIYFAYFSGIWLAMPLEVLIKVFKRIIRGAWQERIIRSVLVGIMALALFMVLKYNILRPLAPVYYFQPTGTTVVDMKIMKDYNKHTWTAVSPVNNISAILNQGYHYELSDFMLRQENWDDKEEIIIPTEYVFVFVEKRPIIAFGNRFDRKDKEITNRPLIKEEDASEKLVTENSPNYHYEKERHILMAKAYAWAQVYQKYFPREMNIYYEDSELVVYRIKQNPYALLNFSINYGKNSGGD